MDCMFGFCCFSPAEMTKNHGRKPFSAVVSPLRAFQKHRYAAQAVGTHVIFWKASDEELALLAVYGQTVDDVNVEVDADVLQTGRRTSLYLVHTLHTQLSSMTDRDMIRAVSSAVNMCLRIRTNYARITRKCTNYAQKKRIMQKLICMNYVKKN